MLRRQSTLTIGILITALLTFSVSLTAQDNARSTARGARARASAVHQQAGGAHVRLLAVQKTLLRANEVYFNFWGQMKRTEAKIVRTRHRRHIVTARYNRRRILFGRRLAAMQRAGRLSYLQIFFGSRTLSDLTRRIYLFQALVSRDAQLQDQLKADKAELDALHNRLMAQWQDRNRLQRSANHERERVVLAHREQRQALQELLSSRTALLAYAAHQEQSVREMDAALARERARRRAILASYEEDADDEPRSYRRSRSYGRVRYARSYDSFDHDDEPRSFNRNSRSRTRYRYSRYRSYRRYGGNRRYRRYARRVRYERQSVPYRVRRVHYVRQAGGILKPMSISEIVFRDERVPVPQSSGALREDAPARRDSVTVGGDDFPASPGPDNGGGAP